MAREAVGCAKPTYYFQATCQTWTRVDGNETLKPWSISTASYISIKLERSKDYCAETTTQPKIAELFPIPFVNRSCRTISENILIDCSPLTRSLFIEAWNAVLSPLFRGRVHNQPNCPEPIGLEAAGDIMNVSTSESPEMQIKKTISVWLIAQ
eukprot:1327410-Amorphochlora_amoeboformis.AAC.1